MFKLKKNSMNLMFLMICLMVSIQFINCLPLTTTTTNENKLINEKRKIVNVERRFNGKATWFYPDTGACGDVNSSNDYIVAMNQAQYSGGSPCHKMVLIKNTSNGKSVTAKVTDECPSCGYGSLDLSPSVFKALGDMDTGVLPIEWVFT